jgi:hypothetical protein
MTDLPHPSYSPDGPLRLFTVSHHCDTTDVIKAELQVVLYSITEHNFQDAFKKRTQALGMWKGTILRVMVASRTKVSF